jgi:hypothetical protein
MITLKDRSIRDNNKYYCSVFLLLPSSSMTEDGAERGNCRMTIFIGDRDRKCSYVKFGNH